MTFDHIKNNGPLIGRVRDAIKCGNIAHAYIFECGGEGDKKAIADCFAKAVLCSGRPGTGCDSCIVCRKISHGNYEDLLYVERDGAGIKDEAIEELQSKLKKKPCAGARNIAVISDADTMTKRAQNRLLKTLEEPFPGTVIVLLSDNTENLAATILSRCVILRWDPVNGGLNDLSGEAEIPARMLLDGAPFYLTKQKVMNFAEDRDQAIRFLDSVEFLYGKYLKERSYSRAVLYGAIKRVEKARRDLTQGMNISYTLKHMILEMEEK